MSVREYAILYVNGRLLEGGGSIAGGGTIVLATAKHRLDGPEHTDALDSTTLDATSDHHGLLPKLSGDAGDVLLGDGTFAPPPPSAETDPIATAIIAALELDDLADVNAPTPAGGDALTWDTGTSRWISSAILSSSTTFADLGWFNVRDYGAVGDGVTDDTVAVQAAIDACHAAGGGTIYFPPGIYQISGALVSTSTYNSQLKIPFQAFTSMSVAIRFLGSGPNRIYQTPGDGEAIIRTDWAGTISGHPAVLSCGSWRDLSTLRSNVMLTFENLTFAAPDDPKLTMLQLTDAAWASFHNVMVCNATTVPSGYPTHSNAVAVEFPFGLSYANEEVSNLAIYGFYVGVRPSEQTFGTIGFAYCKVAMELVAQQDTAPYIRWPNHFPKLTFVSCDTGIKATGTGKRWITGTATFEHDASPFTTTYDIDDGSNILHGFLTIHPTDFTTGPTDGLVNNAQKLSYHQPDQDWWRLHSQVHIPTGTNPTANPYSGRTIFTDSGTGHLSVRTPAGTVIDLESASALTVKDEGGALATAATSIDFVGAGVTATGTGAAKTVTIPGGTVSVLDDLTDTTIATPAAADRLRYDGSLWKNSGLIWSPIMVLDPVSGNYLVLTDTSGNPIMAEV